MAGGEPKKSDLGVRTLSAVVMVAVAGTALWLGGWVWTVFVAAVALGVLWEWRGLVVGFEPSPVKRGLWNAGGLVYVALALLTLIQMRHAAFQPPLFVLALVVAIDVGAYFFGRTLGGPKIAPSISPSKTWAGLMGGVVGAALVQIANIGIDPSIRPLSGYLNVLGILLLIFFSVVFACTAQIGDFFESWMKRKAGVKDSSNLIPGHGGLFDRVDGLLALLCLFALAYRIS